MNDFERKYPAWPELMETLASWPGVDTFTVEQHPSPGAVVMRWSGPDMAAELLLGLDGDNWIFYWLTSTEGAGTFRRLCRDLGVWADNNDVPRFVIPKPEAGELFRGAGFEGGGELEAAPLDVIPARL